jgi:ribosomal protein S18 acetylase RimI-like enzyme
MLSVRLETDDDLEAVVALHIRAWQKGYQGLLPDEVLDNLDPAAWAQRRREIRNTAAPRSGYVAEVNGEIAGFVQFGPDREDPACGEIYAIYVEPDRWGSGVGRALLDTALKSLPHNEIRLWVLDGNDRALRFYARYGLHPNGTRSTYTPRGSDFAAPEMQLSLRRGQ